MNARIISIFFIVVCFISGCAVNNFDISSLKKKFAKHQAEYDSLAELIKTQNLPAGHSVNVNDLPDSIKQILNDLDISDVNLNYTACENATDYEFVTNWNRNAIVYFVKVDCDKKQGDKNYHSKSKMIEVWGLGNDWIMWVDYDFI